MKMNFGTVVISAGLCGLLSFILLAVSISTKYWYIIDVDEGKNSSLEYSSSHSGLWRIYEGKITTQATWASFMYDLTVYSASDVSSSSLKAFKHPE